MKFGTISMSMYTYFSTATFDVQTVTVKDNGSMIAVTGRFITDSYAKGCFIAIQFNETIADDYYVSQNGLEQTRYKTIFNVPFPTYTLFAYDIEDDGLPNEMAAMIQEHDINVTTYCKSVIVYIHNQPFPFGTPLKINVGKEYMQEKLAWVTYLSTKCEEQCV